MRVPLIIAASLAVFVLAQPAHAQTAGADTLTVDLAASIAQRCGIKAVGATTLTGASIDRAESYAFDFTLDCNTPFAIGVKSGNGALKLAGSSAIDAAGQGFSILKPYAVSLSVQTDNGPLEGGSCASEKLTGPGQCAFYGASSGEGLSSGQRTAIERTGSVGVSWTVVDGEARRAAGTYQDTLTIIVGVRS